MSSIVVDLKQRSVSMPRPVRNAIGKALQALGDYFVGGVPLDRFFEILKANDVIPVDEDGTEWGGMLLGAKEVGTDECLKNQHASIRLAYSRPVGGHRNASVGALLNDVAPEVETVPLNEALQLTWGRMPAPSQRWEVIKYVA